MIEVEKKFRPTKEQLDRMITDAEFVSDKKIRDAYYDKKDHALVLSDRFLRNRDGRWELKVGKQMVGRGRVQVYDEYETEVEICEQLELVSDRSFEEVIEKAGYVPFVTFVTQRTTYKDGDMRIDIDSMDFGYQVVEIEKMVENEADVERAADEIVKFAKQYGIKVKRFHGKLIAYLMDHNPELGQKLIDMYNEMDALTGD